MPQFRYQAVDQTGEPYEGVMEEDSAANLTAVLQERGYQVNTVERINQPTGFASRRLSWEDIDLLNAHLVSIAKPGLPFAPALKALAQDIERPRLRRVLKEIQRDLEMGASMEQAFAKHPNDFPPGYSAILRAGERMGNLPAVLEMLNQYSTRMVRMKSSIKTALFYPALVVVSSAWLFLFLLTNVIPSFKEIFGDLGTNLPQPTQLIIFLSDVVVAHYERALMGAVLIILGVFFFLVATRRNEKIRALKSALLERIPVFGQSYRIASIARFSRSLGLLLSSGVPTLESLDLAGMASGNYLLRQRIRRVTEDVSNGSSISEALESTRYFTHTFLWIVENSETRNQLPESLLTQGDALQRELYIRDQMLTLLLAPTAILLSAIPAGFVIAALYMPIFSMGDAI